MLDQVHADKCHVLKRLIVHFDGFLTINMPEEADDADCLSLLLLSDTKVTLLYMSPSH